MSQSGDVVLLTENNTVHFTGAVTDQSVAKAQRQMGMVSARLSSTDVIYLVIDSPGGSVMAGNLFIDFANSLPQKIKPICIFCASMGYHMFQSFEERLVFSSSSLMSHRVSIGGLSGQIPGEAISRLQSIIDTSNEMDEKVAKRVGISVGEYKKLIYDELWLSGSAAVKSNHADKIARIRCSKSLLTGTQKSTVGTIFGPVSVTTSKCPLISGILDYKFEKKLFRSDAEALRLVKKAKRSVLRRF
jgi:ATP-dependent protease ClpP protease subunit